jgi:hypothetical protein
MTDGFTENDDGGFRAGARRLRIRVVRSVEFAVLVFLQRTGTLLLRVAPRRFDLDKLRTCGNLAVDVRSDFQMEARRVKALVALHIRKQAGVISAAARTGKSKLRQRG